jgi:hypothetical protein
MNVVLKSMRINIDIRLDIDLKNPFSKLYIIMEWIIDDACIFYQFQDQMYSKIWSLLRQH